MRLPFFMLSHAEIQPAPNMRSIYGKYTGVRARRVLVLIQVGGFASGAADAAPSPARYRARAPRQAHVPQSVPNQMRKNGTVRARHRREPAWRLPRAYRNGHFPFYSRICTFGIPNLFAVCFFLGLYLQCGLIARVQRRYNGLAQPALYSLTGFFCRCAALPCDPFIFFKCLGTFLS